MKPLVGPKSGGNWRDILRPHGGRERAHHGPPGGEEEIRKQSVAVVLVGPEAVFVDGGGGGVPAARAAEAEEVTGGDARVQRHRPAVDVRQRRGRRRPLGRPEAARHAVLRAWPWPSEHRQALGGGCGGGGGSSNDGIVMPLKP